MGHAFVFLCFAMVAMFFLALCGVGFAKDYVKEEFNKTGGCFGGCLSFFGVICAIVVVLFTIAKFLLR